MPFSSIVACPGTSVTPMRSSVPGTQAIRSSSALRLPPHSSSAGRSWSYCQTECGRVARPRTRRSRGDVARVSLQSRVRCANATEQTVLPHNSKRPTASGDAGRGRCPGPPTPSPATGTPAPPGHRDRHWPGDGRATRRHGRGEPASLERDRLRNSDGRLCDRSWDVFYLHLGTAVELLVKDRRITANHGPFALLTRKRSRAIWSSKAQSPSKASASRSPI